MRNKLFLLATVTLLFVACGAKTTTQTSENETMENGVEVLYFHGKQRCVTCKAIERLTREVIEENFAKELKNGTIVFHVIDITQPENEAIADEYEVAFSSLFLTKWINSVSIKTNMTDLAFS